MSSETVTISKAEYESLKQTNQELVAQVRLLTEQIALARAQRFGRSSEKTLKTEEGEQLSFLFNEAEVYVDSAASAETAARENEPELTVVKGYKRHKHVTRIEDLPENVDIEVVDKTLPEEERVCPQCGEQMEDIGQDVIRKLKIIPARVVVVETHIHRYACANCQKNADSTPVISAKVAPAVIPGSNATPEAISYLAVEKFVMYSPLYRMEQQFNRIGVPLSRQTMSNWLLKACSLWLKPIWQRMKERLVKEEVLHADETTLQVLKEAGRKATSTSYMWLYRTSGCSAHQLVLYEYQETRSASHPAEFLRDFKGYLHTDGYAGYHKLNRNIQVIGCLAHARRKFEDALKAMPEEARKDSVAMRGVRYYDALFKLETEWASLSPQERKEKRSEYAAPILKELYDWVLQVNAAPKSLLGKALLYTRKQWPWLIGYLKDGRLEISNNRAERSIKPFVMGRKNFLFANTPGGAQGSAIYFSLIESAKENGLDPYRYLTWILTTAPTLDMKNEESVNLLLPANAPIECRVGIK